MIELEHPIFASNDRTSNFEANRAFTRFTKLLIELIGTLFFQTLNKLEHVHLLVIELKHPIFGLRTIEHLTFFNPSLIISLALLLPYDQSQCSKDYCIVTIFVGKVKMISSLAKINC